MLSQEDGEEYLVLMSPAWLLTKWSLGLRDPIEKVSFKEIIYGVEALDKDSIWSEPGKACFCYNRQN